TCAILADSTARCWGDNDHGQIGDGTVTVPGVQNNDRHKPVLVNGGTGFVSISGGVDFTCASKASGVVLCWGINADGQMGNGQSGADQPTPGPVTSLSSVAAVAGAGSYTCALRSVGIVSCWGRTVAADGTVGKQATPLTVPGLLY